MWSNLRETANVCFAPLNQQNIYLFMVPLSTNFSQTSGTVGSIIVQKVMRLFHKLNSFLIDSTHDSHELFSHDCCYNDPLNQPLCVDLFQ